MSGTNPFRFSTKYQDPESDLLYYGYRYYDAITGRWLSRDPIAEKGGPNLYGLLRNEPLTAIDRLGLLETRFRRNSRRLTGTFTSGHWSQPDGFGDGAYTESDTWFSSWIRLWSGPARNGICNSIDGTLWLPEIPGAPSDENPQRSHHAGAFILDAKNDCRARFRIYVSTSRVVKSKGPNGNAQATIWIYGRPETSISVVGDDIKQNAFGASIDVTLGRRWKSLVFYYPTISFNATPQTPLKESEGEAYGSVTFVGFDAL